MSRHRAITAALDDETIAQIESIAASRGMSIEDYAAEAIRGAVQHEATFTTFVQVGIDQIERGEIVQHDAVMAELSERIGRHRARCE